MIDELGVALFLFTHRELPTDFGAFGVCAGFADGSLSGRFKCAQATDFLKNTFGFHLVFETLQSTVDRLAFFNFDLWHDIFAGLTVFMVAVGNDFSLVKGRNLRVVPVLVKGNLSNCLTPWIIAGGLPGMPWRRL